MFDTNIDCKFQSELFLEDFVWETLKSLLNLKPLARQLYFSNQVCDILTIDEKQQLTLVELKNTEDRYLIQQLTRYYDAIQEHQPFQEQVDYRLPIRLIAIAPHFHSHNLIDRDYNRLTFELFTFRIVSTDVGSFWFELSQIDHDKTVKLNIPKKFHRFLLPAQEKPVELLPVELPPPKSLQKLIEGLSPEQQANVLSIRNRLLSFDESMMEVGLTTRTLYGLRKNNKDIYKTKLCAEFIPITPGILYPQLRLRLPYAKREFGAPGRTYKQERVKGLTWVGIKYGKEWDDTATIQLLFYFGKRQRYSYALDLGAYSNLYQQLTGHNQSLQSFDDLLTVALEEWRLQLNSQDPE